MYLAKIRSSSETSLPAALVAVDETQSLIFLSVLGTTTVPAAGAVDQSNVVLSDLHVLNKVLYS